MPKHREYPELPRPEDAVLRLSSKDSEAFVEALLGAPQMLNRLRDAAVRFKKEHRYRRPAGIHSLSASADKPCRGTAAGHRCI
jgi:hypothetical protein